MAILKHIASKSSNYGAALEYLIFKHDEYRKTPILDKNGNRIMRDEFYLDGLNCEPYSFDAACQQLNREYQKNKNKNEIKSHHYIISFDPRDSTENCLTGKRAQELGLEYAKANFPGHQALVCTHMDGHNGSGNIHVHIVINSLRKLDVPKQPFMERPIDCKAGYKHHVTNDYLKHLQKSLMDLCQREFLHQVDLLSPSRTGVTEAEYWAQRRLDEKKQEIEKEGFTPNPTKFQTQKQLIRDAVAAAREKAISYEDFQDILQDEYNIFVKTQRGRYSYLPPERNKFISERPLGESCKRECLEGFFVQNAEKNLRYKEDPILIFTTRTRLRLVVDLQENVKAQENLAYALKVKISNLQKNFQRFCGKLIFSCTEKAMQGAAYPCCAIPLQVIQVVPDWVVMILIGNNANCRRHSFFAVQTILFHSTKNVHHIRVGQCRVRTLPAHRLYNINAFTQQIQPNGISKNRVVLQNSHTVLNRVLNTTFFSLQEHFADVGNGRSGIFGFVGQSVEPPSDVR